MSKTPNQQGRALEYAIVEELIRKMPKGKITLSQNALQDQKRDCVNYQELSDSRKHNYKLCAVQIFNWLNSKFYISQNCIVVNRLSDSHSRGGDPTDIKISCGSETINLSIKHNHTACKHQRPASTAQHCGYGKGSQEDKLFRKKYAEITKEFMGISKNCFHFRDLNEGIVLNELYIPTCELISSFVNTYCESLYNANYLFNFLVGKTDFYKVIFYEDKSFINIQEFIKIPKITSVLAENSQSYVNLLFSNNWEISMRLHTASSRIQKNPSLKFDTKPVKINVPEQNINIQGII